MATSPINGMIVPPDLGRDSAGGAATLHHPAFGRSQRAEVYRIPNSNQAATAATIAHMWRLSHADSSSDLVQAAAELATRGAQSGKEAAAGIWAWIKSRIEFVSDEKNAQLAGLADPETELLIRPVDLLRMQPPSGDCDDFSMLCASMLLASGIEPAFKTVAADRHQPGEYSHVYVLALLPDGPLPLDCSHGSYAGWEVPAPTKFKVWRMPAMRSQLHGLGEDTEWWSSALENSYAPVDVSYAESLPTYSSNASSTASTFNVGSFLNTLVNGAAGVAKVAVSPSIPAGTYYSTGPNGTTIYRAAQGSSLTMPTLGTGTSSLLIYGGLALLALLLFSRK